MIVDMMAVSALQFVPWRQWLKSRHVYAFQLPWLAERGFARNNFEAAGRALADVKRMTAEDVAQYKAACAQPSAPAAMIGWYRALAKWVVGEEASLQATVRDSDRADAGDLGRARRRAGQGHE